MSGIGGIVLAAGSSRRFGDDKRKQKLATGKSVIEQSILTAAAALDQVMVVLRFGDQSYLEELRSTINLPNVTYFRAPDSARGMAHSLSNAIHQVKDWDGAVVLLADMPFLQPGTIHQVVSTWEKHRQNDPIVMPEIDGKVGHPVLFPKAYFAEIEQLEGDRGARPVIEEHEQKVITLVVEDRGILLDIDRPEDIRA
ncbi:MAG: NTP transferase domain-containing protein [Pseudomonadota bacterium]